MIRSEHIDCWKLTNTKQIKNIPRMEMLSAFLTLRIFIVDYPNDPIVWILSHHTHTHNTCTFEVNLITQRSHWFALYIQLRSI